MHVEVRNACASEEICACKSKCLAMTITLFYLQIPLRISATQVVGMREKEQESRERCHEVPVEAGCIMGI